MTLLPPSYVPRRSRTIHAEILNDEICIYDWTTRRVHALNATAARVWELCDGVTSVAQIANTLHADLGVEHVDDVVRLAVAEFSEAGLLEGPLPAGQLALSRRDIVKRVGLTAAMLPVVSSIAAPSALQAQSSLPNPSFFSFTGASQTFVVPGGVTQITVTAIGAWGFFGGGGGGVTATIPVTAAETLTVNVGGQGGFAPVPDFRGGFNGGGTGNGEGIFDGRGGGGGGGASDVRRGSTRLVVAGGGGGRVGNRFGPITVGGLGGGMIGGAGGSNSLTGAGGGGGGTQSAGGTGGAAGPGGDAGTPGASGTGGSGGSFGGAGGGGGYFGGGGGGGTRTGDPFEGGGGGGGSSYTDPAATFVTHGQGGGMGEGRVVISW